MTESSYKLVLMAKDSCREAEFTAETEDGFRIGTERSCAMRYRKECFFDDFYLEFHRSASGWTLQCSENIHVTRDGVLRLQSLELTHGLSFRVSNRSDLELFRCSFLLDFERTDRSYRREIDLSGQSAITIGGTGEIVLNDPLVGSDRMTLTREGDGWTLQDHKTRYGVACNGTLLTAPTRLQNRDFFSLVGYAFFLKDEHLYTDPAEGCDIHLPYTDLPETNNQFRYPQFNRSTRLQYQVPDKEIEVLPPQPKQTQKRKSILFSLVPALSMLAMVVLLRGVMGGGGSFVLYSACSMSIGIIMSIVTYISDGKAMKQAEVKRQADYRQYIEEKQLQITCLREQELETLRVIHTDLEEDLSRAQQFDQRLFERAPEDPDYLETYLGSGEIEAPNQLKVTSLEFKNTDDPLTELPEQLAAQFRFLADGPVVAQLRTDQCLGLVGDDTALVAMLRNLTLDLCTRHYFRDVKLVYLLGDQNAADLEDLRWLPHVQSESGDLRGFGYDAASRNAVLEMLYAALSAREAENPEQRENDPSPSPHFVTFVFGDLSLAKHPISRYFEHAERYGCTFLFFANYKEELPRGCGEVLLLDATAGGTLVGTSNAAKTLTFRSRPVEPARFHEAVMKLAATQVDEISLQSELTKNISLYELLGIVTAEDLDLTARWNRAQVFRSMAAPLGVNRKSETVYLDIGDKSGAHGPHGLVAGTTGSGKSELLQSYILSMATLFHPYEVSFVIIDFKGGGMANQFRDLPHLLGSITNIDGREIDRSLLSIKAELVRRQALFAAAGVNHVNDYIKLYKGGEVQLPLPHLIIIVDEFAELKSEFPNFMKELISAARIGRTLGIHLILATQKPSGVVDAQIWANSKFKLCLKVQNKEDSNEVLKSPLAAEIKEPGRAYFQVGNNELFELFQSAYGGAPVPNIESAKNQVYEINSVAPWGERKLVYTSKGAAGGKEEMSQLQALINYIGGYCDKKSIAHLPGICLPPLPDLLPLTAVAQPPHGAGIVAAVGCFDDPEQQLQAPLLLDLTAENTLIIGASQMGKTNLLRTLACALIGQYSPAEVSLYFIDCGSMALHTFALSGHCGGVVLATEEERMENLFKLLHRTVALRRKLFSDKGISTYSAYLEGGFQDLPQIVVLLDNIAAFREYYDTLADDLMVLTREGLGLGVSFVLTGTQANAMSYKAMANFSRRIAFTCTDSGEYGNLFGHSSLSPKPVPGRCLVMQEKRVLECQIAQSGTAARELERVEQLRSFLTERRAEYPDLAAQPIPMVPEQLLENDLFAARPHLFRTPYRLPMGMDYGQVDWQSLDLLQCGSLVLTGPDSASRAGFIRYLLSALSRSILISDTEGYVFDDDNHALRGAQEYGFVREYMTDRDKAIVYLDLLAEKFRARRERQKKSPLDDLRQEPLLLIVLESRALLQAICGDKAASQTLLELMEQAQSCKALILMSNLENSAPSYSAPELLKTLREQRQGLFFGSLGDCRFYEVQTKQAREFTHGIRSGDCFLFRGNQIFRMKSIQQNKEVQA